MDKYLFFFLLFACASLSHSDSKSCNGRCGQGYYKGSLCQCDYECLGLNECCTDFKSLCTTKNSCKGRCGEPFERGNTCHCDNDCITYNQCCPDYESFCLMEESSNEDMTNYEGEDLETPVDESASAFLPAEATPSKAKCPPTIKPAAEPATTKPTAEPEITKPTAETATTKPTAEPATTKPIAEPATTTPAAEPATTKLTAEPATTTPTAEPATTTPTEGSPSTTPTEGSPSTTPTEGSPSTTPTEGSPSTTPTEGSPSTTPTEGLLTTTPTEDLLTTTPTEGLLTTTPTEGLLTTTPTEGSPTTTKTPTEGSPTTTPTESLTTKRPKEGSPTTTPSESPTTTTPTESPTTTTPTESPMTTTPTEVPAKGPTNKPVPKPFKPSLENNDKKDTDSELYQADDYDTNLCSGRPVSGLTTLRNGTIVVFRGHYFWTLDRNRNPDPPRLITSVWGIPSPIDTVYTRCNCLGKTYFFKGNNYWRFENDVMDPDFPKPISEGFGRISHITAALSMPQYRSRRESVIFFRRGGKAQTYTYQVTPDCGKRPVTPGIGLRNRYRRGTDSALGTVITISNTWRGFPTTVTSAVSVPSRVKEGYKYYVFSQGNSHSIKMERDKPVILKPANSQKENTANSFFKCPKSDKD